MTTILDLKPQIDATRIINVNGSTVDCRPIFIIVFHLPGNSAARGVAEHIGRSMSALTEFEESPVRVMSVSFNIVGAPSADWRKSSQTPILAALTRYVQYNKAEINPLTTLLQGKTRRGTSSNSASYCHW